jgi:hypothetical protein
MLKWCGQCSMVFYNQQVQINKSYQHSEQTLYSVSSLLKTSPADVMERKNFLDLCVLCMWSYFDNPYNNYITKKWWQMDARLRHIWTLLHVDLCKLNNERGGKWFFPFYILWISEAWKLLGILLSPLAFQSTIAHTRIPTIKKEVWWIQGSYEVDSTKLYFTFPAQPPLGLSNHYYQYLFPYG